MELLPDYEFIVSDTMEFNPIAIRKGMFTVVDHGRFYLSKTPEKRARAGIPNTPATAPGQNSSSARTRYSYSTCTSITMAKTPRQKARS